MYSMQKRTRKEAASIVVEPGISHENVKMEDKQDNAANMAKLNTWPRPRQGRKRQLRQRARKLPSARSQLEQAEWRRYERMDSYGAYGAE